MTSLYPQIHALDARTERAVVVFHEIAEGAREHGWNVAFLSGFAIDAHFGYLTKNHKDVDLIIKREESAALAEYLTEKGHHVYESKKFIGEVLKVDQADPEKDTQAHADIHFYEEVGGKIIIPLMGKELVLNGTLKEVTTSKTLLDETVTVLRPEFILEEKEGWCKQIGLSQCRDKPEVYQADIRKIKFLIEAEGSGY